MTYEIEITDTYGGEANYSWVKRYSYQAKSFLGAIGKLSREHGKGWRLDYSTGDMARYKLNGACIVAFITYSGD